MPTLNRSKTIQVNLLTMYISDSLSARTGNILEVTVSAPPLLKGFCPLIANGQFSNLNYHQLETYNEIV